MSSRLPSLSYTVRRSYVDAFFAREVVQIPAGARVLDLGGHKELKRGKFDIGSYPLQVTYANLSPRKGVDVAADGALLPFAPAAFDVVLCAELLEHVLDPQSVLAEARRVTRPGGLLLATTPFLYRIHADPHDYGRYTDTWWRLTLGRTGYSLLSIEKQGHYFGVMTDFLSQAADLYAVRPLRRPVEALLGAAKEGARLLDAASPVRNQPFLNSFTTGFGVVARAGSEVVPLSP